MINESFQFFPDGDPKVAVPRAARTRTSTILCPTLKLHHVMHSRTSSPRMKDWGLPSWDAPTTTSPNHSFITFHIAPMHRASIRKITLRFVIIYGWCEDKGYQLFRANTNRQCVKQSWSAFTPSRQSCSSAIVRHRVLGVRKINFFQSLSFSIFFLQPLVHRLLAIWKVRNRKQRFSFHSLSWSCRWVILTVLRRRHAATTRNSQILVRKVFKLHLDHSLVSICTSRSLFH